MTCRLNDAFIGRKSSELISILTFDLWSWDEVVLWSEAGEGFYGFVCPVCGFLVEIEFVHFMRELQIIRATYAGNCIFHAK